MTANSTTVTESEILAEVIAPGDGDLSPEVARSVLKWRFTDRAIARMNGLAERNNKGTITDDERQELERYLRVGSFINLIQAKAHLSLKSREAPDS
jgi:hypothetical protein